MPNEKSAEANDYKCHYCKHEFKQVVNTYGNVVDHVVCPKCGNGLKSFEKKKHDK